MKHLLTAVLVGVALSLPISQHSKAGPENVPWSYGSIWEDPCLTHDGPPELDQAVAEALALWGESSAIGDCGTDPGDPDILIRWANLAQFSAAGLAATHFWPGGPIEWVEIDIDDDVDVTVPGGFNVVLHEVGHALGLGHPFEDAGLAAPSVMNSPYHGLTDLDRAAIAELYPPGVIGDEPVILYRVIVPGLRR